MSLLNALRLGGWLRSVDVSLAKTLSRLREETPDRVLAAAALASRAVANGHSRLPLSQVAQLLQEIDAERALPDLPPTQEWLAVLAGSPWTTGQPLVLEGEALSLRRYWRHEIALASALSARMADPRLEAIDATSEEWLSRLFPDDLQGAQARAARAALASRFLLLTGGPGTGKTSTVARTLVLFAEQFARSQGGHAARIALAAPTGKAATRLAESVRENLARLVREGVLDPAVAHSLPDTASTLHRLLGWRRGSVAFIHDADNPLPADLVVVDEASMVDLPMMSRLLDAVSAEATLVLIGDRDQLPSVETGDVLAALCDAHLPNRVHLDIPRRQVAEVDVSRIAGLVRDGNDEAVVRGLRGEEFRGVSWMGGADAELADAVLAQALPAYRAVLAAPGVVEALEAARAFRVLTAVREGPAGSNTLNALVAGALDPTRRGDGFFAGRLLLVTENSYRHQLFNGDIGVVWPDEFGELRAWFDAEGGPRAWLPAALPAHESAFALTVHKSQGSEFDRVFLALPEQGARVLTRELVYTGLTRCRSAVLLWSSETTLREAITRQSQRWSGLAQRLKPPDD